MVLLSMTPCTLYPNEAGISPVNPFRVCLLEELHILRRSVTVRFCPRSELNPASGKALDLCWQQRSDLGNVKLDECLLRTVPEHFAIFRD